MCIVLYTALEQVRRNKNDNSGIFLQVASNLPSLPTALSRLPTGVVVALPALAQVLRESVAEERAVGWA